MFYKFYKNAIHVQIFRGPDNHMTPVTSNNGDNLPELEYAIVEKKGFQIPPLPSSNRIGEIHTICFKNCLFRPFEPILRQIGRAGPVWIRGVNPYLSKFKIIWTCQNTPEQLFSGCIGTFFNLNNLNDIRCTLSDSVRFTK